MESFSRVALICPCKIEYDKCKSTLNLDKEMILSGRNICSKRYNKCEVFAIFAGPGIIQCTSATQLVIDKFHCDLVIDVGGAGSLCDEFNYNDIIIAREVYEFDICEIKDYETLKDDLTSKTIFKDMSNEHAKYLNETISCLESLTNQRIKFGDIASGEKTIKDRETRNMLNSKLGAHACNWETSSVIKTANLNNIVGISIRVITDNADENMDKDFYTNWGNSLENLFTVLNIILEKL
ncbi:5'-methylthioadenosine/S-adenosylhomocysteine nucleosidase [Clostridium omnivorum]|uniref:Nucleoside phosphorylase domain-containing protein n=1 Tax=Clostridium omnivorum TaxID=1604902 RepID=A0ABQ5N1W2_9CLOT|nr:5'-methylthioadenosine/S-adenosylhomocysteine nucleosidase [Clostridium sp. E14]GLC29180.1 hypothetical protein bsdE14_05900 [Clostridium sp. E14]